ncbi:MAG TPA: hypothetical protein VJV79_30560 [Polyangiaceae bacterium]|nr:hypothetical protein [Polyangiaceae bacterium]
MIDQNSGETLPPSLEPIAPPPPAPLLQGFPLDPWARPRRVPRPLVGVSLWCFGALFWSYLVVGEIVVWTAVPEALGVLAVLGAFGVAWYRGTSQMPAAPRWRVLLPGVIAFCSWLVALLMSAAVFSTGGRKNAELAALLLWAFAAGAYALGRRLTALNRVSSSPLERVSRIALWVIAGLATLMAGVNIISYA